MKQLWNHCIIIESWNKEWEFYKGLRSMVRVMCGVQVRDSKTYTNLMFMLILSETIDHFAMADRVR